MTLKDVARLAGVSAITVSRVLNGNYVVREKTKQRVLDAVATLNYKPNAIARSLRNAKTHTIGVLIPDISNPYFMRLIRSLETALQMHGYSIILTSSDDQPDKERRMLDVLTARVDAVVMAPCQMKISAAVQGLITRNVPVILIDRSANDVDFATVVEENERSTYELIKHLVLLGHRDIAIVTSNAPISTVVERQTGYVRALEEHAITLNPDFILAGQFDEQTGYAFAKRLLARNGKRPTALFCTNNSITVGAMIAIRELGMQIPDDISVVSFGDLLLPELIQPRITAVIQNPESVGETTARVLMENLQNPEARYTEKLVLPTHIRLGDSVHPATRVMT